MDKLDDFLESHPNGFVVMLYSPRCPYCVEALKWFKRKHRSHLLQIDTSQLAPDQLPFPPDVTQSVPTFLLIVNSTIVKKWGGASPQTKQAVLNVLQILKQT